MRLTNDMRTDILRAAISGIFADKERKLAVESNELAILVFDSIYPTDIQHQMKKLPNGFFAEKTPVFLRTEKNGYNIELTLLSSRRVTYKDACGWQMPIWLPEHQDNAILKRALLLVDQRKQVAKAVSKMKEAIQTMLAGVITIKRLREEWPDGLPYYSAVVPAVPTANLPAVRGADITAMILELEEVSE